MIISVIRIVLAKQVLSLSTQRHIVFLRTQIITLSGNFMEANTWKEDWTPGKNFLSTV